MRARLFTMALLVALLAVVLPAPGKASADTPVTSTVVDRIDSLAPQATTQHEARARTRGYGGATAAPAARSALTSAPTKAPIAFSMVAFTASAGVDVTYRTSVDGQSWTAWQDAEPAEGQGPDHGSDEAMRAAPDHRRSGEPLWVGDASWLQARVSAGSVDDVEVDLIDSMGLSRSLWKRTGDAVRTAWHGAGPAVAQAAGRPKIVTRAQWGADESLRSGQPSVAASARYAVLHHTAGTNTYSRAEAPGVVRGIYAYHTRSRGWSDIGYNFLVDKFGTVYEGRAGGMERAVIGAHVAGFNTHSIGVSMIGNHDSAAVTAATRTAVSNLLAWKFAIHGIDPGGSVDVTSTCTGGACKHPRGTVVTMPTLFGHRDVGRTSCPGAHGYATLPGIRSAIANRQVDALANHSVAPTTVQLDDNGLAVPVVFGVDVVPAGSWEFVVKYDDGTVMHEQAGSGDRADIRWEGRAGMPTGTYWYKFTSPGRSPAIGKFTVAEKAFEPPFSDDDRSVHREGIVDLFTRHITNGCTATEFCPTREVSREQMASFLSRTLTNLKLPHRTAARDHFSDDNGSVHEGAINTLTEDGVSAGCADGSFCPKEAIKRGDIAVWLARAFHLESSGVDHFGDDNGQPYEWAVNALADAGLTEGCDADRYCADDVTSRGQMASFLSRAIRVIEART